MLSVVKSVNNIGQNELNSPCFSRGVRDVELAPSNELEKTSRGAKEWWTPSTRRWVGLGDVESGCRERKRQRVKRGDVNHPIWYTLAAQVGTKDVLMEIKDAVDAALPELVNNSLDRREVRGISRSVCWKEPVNHDAETDYISAD